MELSFVISALKRRSWVIVVFATLGFVLSLLMAPKDTSYQSSAELVVRQPSGADFDPFDDKDRYIATEISVIKSLRFAEEAAVKVNEQYIDLNITGAEIAGLITIEPLPKTDIVLVISNHENGELPPKISNAYAQAYIDSLTDSDVDINQAEIEQLEMRLTGDPTDEQSLGLVGELEQVNNDLDRKVGGDDRALEVIDPGLTSKRNFLEAEIIQLTSERNSLVSESAVRVNSRLFQEAASAFPISSSFSMFIVAGVIGGALLGLVVALTWARFSTKVLDKISVGELLGTPIAADFPHYRSLARNTLAAFKALPRSAVPEIDQLCVRAEAMATRGDRLVVAVVGTQRGAGATTLALAMAEQFATSGSPVVLIDGDVRDPLVSAAFNASTNGGIPAVIANDGALVDRQGISVFTKTMDPRVSVLGVGSNKSTTGLKRDNVAEVIEAACRKAPIIIMDGGPALDLASTIQLTRLADAVVLATPISRQKVDDLVDIGRQLASVKDKLLPVVTVPAARGNSDVERVQKSVKKNSSMGKNDKATVVFE